MHVPRARCLALIAAAAALLGFTGPAPSAFAQASAPEAPAVDTGVQQSLKPMDSQQQTGVVRQIIIQGAERIDQTTILSYLPIQVGQAVDPAAIDNALKTLFKTDLFADVQIALRGSDLVVQVTENPIINQVVFEGNSNLKEEKLRDEVQVRPRGVFTRAKVQADVQRIVELYRRSGRVAATVTPKIVELPQKRVDLVFEINEGPKSGILNINVQGNKEFSDSALRDVIVTKESKWYRFFTSNDNYDPDRIEYDREQLRKFYRNRGFYDFHVLSAVAELVPEKNGFNVSYVLEEGGRYKFGKITVETDLKRLKPQALERLLPVREGQLFTDDVIEKSTDALTFAAGAAGFAFVDVRPRMSSNPKTHTIDVNFQITEGPRVYVERIDVVGNSRTIDPVIRRELLVSEGDAYNRVLVDRSKMRIRALGFFKDVDIDQLPGSAPDKTVLRVKVTEQPTGELSFSLGYSSVDQLIADIGITERNFRGRGQQVTFRVSAGYLRQELEFGFVEPRFLGRDLSGGYNIYARRLNYSSYTAFKQSSAGANFSLGFPLTDTSRLSWTYNLHADSISVDQSLCVPGQETVTRTLCDQRGSTLTSSISYNYRIDRRDDAIKPTRGFVINVSQEFAGAGGNVRYIKSSLQASWYHAFRPSWVLTIQGDVGDVEPWGNDYIRINDRFYKGGTDFRGFQIAGIGPRDVLYGDALGGKFYTVETVELTFPNGLPEQYGINTALFSDVGTVGILDARAKIDPLTGLPDPNIKDDLALRASAGITVFWKSPMGPLRFDLSQVLKRQPYDRTETFQFRTSTRFQ